MVEKVEMYSVICDNCKGTHESGGIIAWADEGMAIEEAETGGWIEKGGNHYCEDCYYIEVLENG